MASKPDPAPDDHGGRDDPPTIPAPDGDATVEEVVESIEEVGEPSTGNFA